MGSVTGVLSSVKNERRHVQVWAQLCGKRACSAPPAVGSCSVLARALKGAGASIAWLVTRTRFDPCYIPRLGEQRLSSGETRMLQLNDITEQVHVR